MKKTTLQTALFSISLLVTFLTTGCNNGNTPPDVSNIKIDLRTYRFDLDLYALDTAHLSDGLKKLHAQYPYFLDYYLDTLRAYNVHGNYSDSTAGVRSLDTELTYKDFVDLEQTIHATFPDVNDINKQIADGFRYFTYYLPGHTIPRIMYVNLDLSKWATFPVDSGTYCVCLDMFLGPQFPYYRSVGVPDYMNHHLEKSYLPVSFFHTVYQQYYPFAPDDRTLIDLMIQRGKEQYFLHKILPSTADSTLFGYEQHKVEWCNNNENLIYNFFIHQNLIYNKDARLTTQFVNDGPFAKGLEAPDSPVKATPGNIGTWLGYRIVCSYMARHPKMSLAELLSQRIDAAKFLNEADYRPR
jgi:hypothetical protein